MGSGCHCGGTPRAAKDTIRHRRAGEEHYVLVSDSFDAGHQVETRERCRRRHGHHWTVTVTRMSGRVLDAFEADNLTLSLGILLDEWRDRDLNEMIHNFTETTPERLAPWIMERLLAVTQQLTSVEVTDGVVTAKVIREPLR